ncbi:MAG TPA: TCR/Tet family MFS transporter [Steroidobacteraceae bacterium]|jgi:DHA1 family tetracycline resistance protein-like MFS transporter|nr:TCR/Tet family MFS transporter [Steroidobacteraceae bacterium]
MTEREPFDHPRRTAAILFVFVTVTIDMLAFGIIIPVLPHLIVELIGGSIARAAVWSSGFGTLFMLMQFVCSPIQGALSDRFGRRTVILISNLGLGIDFIVMALAPMLWLLFIGRAVSGVCAASFSTANAYIADITPREKRATAYGMLGGAFAVGFIVGPALGGFLGHFWIRLPFWVAAGLSLLNFSYGLFVLPESLPKERRTARIDWRHANPIGSLTLLRRYPQVFALAAVFFLLALAQFSLNSTYVLYTDYRYGWGPQIVGYTLGIVGLCSGLVQAVLVRRWMPWLGERRMMLTGVALLIIGYTLFGLAPAGWTFLAGIPFLSLGGLAGPPAQSMITHQVSPGEQGRLQGALSSLQSLAGIFGPALFANIFALFIGDHAPTHRLPGAAFVLAAALVLVALLLTVRATRSTPAPQPIAEPTSV